MPSLKLPVLIVKKNSLLVGRVADVAVAADTAVESVAVSVVASVAVVAEAVSVANDVEEAAYAVVGVAVVRICCVGNGRGSSG